jgi:hypothetical protein
LLQKPEILSFPNELRREKLAGFARRTAGGG